jgi:hypothetical protein
VMGTTGAKRDNAGRSIYIIRNDGVGGSNPSCGTNRSSVP